MGICLNKIDKFNEMLQTIEVTTDNFCIWNSSAILVTTVHVGCFNSKFIVPMCHIVPDLICLHP